MSTSTQTQALCALVFLYRTVLEDRVTVLPESVKAPLLAHLDAPLGN